MTNGGTVVCPDCGGDIEVRLTHQGKGQGGKWERMVIEAEHVGDVCAGWSGDQTHDLVDLAGGRYA